MTIKIEIGRYGVISVGSFSGAGITIDSAIYIYIDIDSTQSSTY